MQHAYVIVRMSLEAVFLVVSLTDNGIMISDIFGEKILFPIQRRQFPVAVDEMMDLKQHIRASELGLGLSRKLVVNWKFDMLRGNSEFQTWRMQIFYLGYAQENNTLKNIQGYASAYPSTKPDPPLIWHFKDNLGDCYMNGPYGFKIKHGWSFVC
ncbi:hypothetical protein LXL04_006405 [Taraxacum kok-saghyz]